MKISKVRLRQLTGTLEHEAEFWEERLIRPIDVYPEYGAEDAYVGFWHPIPLGDGRYRMQLVFLEIDTDEGVTGLAGPIGHEVAYIIDQQFRRLLMGADAFAIERIWDVLYREAVHGRKGATMLAISAIDCALWDLKGKALDLPVYRLLGGPTRETLPAYASMLGYSLETELVTQRVTELREAGWTATKWFPRGGPVDGKEGIRRNVELARAIREAAGPDMDFMLDAWMSWDVPFTVAVAERIKELEPRWIEEPVLPDKIEVCAEVRRRSPVPTATGEHEYTRWGLKQLMDAGAADVLQPDTYWAGGISELVKICSIASTYDLPVIPHGHSVPANVHLSAALPPTACPMVEFLVKWNDVLQFFWEEPLVPVDGQVTVPNRPGMGMTIDMAKVKEERELDWRDTPVASGSSR